ncbi:MAG: BamA/TamA family outer membrane protein [Bacteroidota bacterium]
MKNFSRFFWKIIIYSSTFILIAFSNYSFSKILTDSAKADSTKYKNTFIFLPAVGYTPNTSWFFGISGNYLFKFKGQDSTTRTSNYNPLFIYTLEKQIIIWNDYTLFFNKEKYILSGDIAFMSYPQVYYGIGNNTPKENKEDVSYSEFFFRQIVSKKVASHLFAKIGYDYYNMFKVEREENGLLDLLERPVGYDGGTASGIILGAGIDSRNNILNSKEGIFLKLTGYFYLPMLGSNFSFQNYKLDFRKYIKPFKNREDVLAFQGYGILNFGETPFNKLAKLGGEMIMRGYYEGRYRDNHLLAFQTEYRLHVWKRIGMVCFAGLGDVANKTNRFNTNDIKYSYGLGLRFKMIKKEDLNIRIDYGITQTSGNFYLSISEAF